TKTSMTAPHGNVKDFEHPSLAHSPTRQPLFGNRRSLPGLLDLARLGEEITRGGVTGGVELLSPYLVVVADDKEFRAAEAAAGCSDRLDLTVRRVPVNPHRNAQGIEFQ